MLKDGTLEAYLDSLEYRAPEEGDGKTVDESCFTIVSTNITNAPGGKGKKLMEAYVYSENNNLQFSDRRLIGNRNRIYFIDSTSNSFTVFIPQSFASKLEECGWTYGEGTGNLFISLLSAFGLKTDGDGYKSVDGDESYFTSEYF